MSVIFTLIRQLGMVALIMGCSVIGTVGLLKLIKQFFENRKEK